MSTEKIMEQAQVFASAWSVVGGPFDGGDAMEVATQEKDELRRMVAELVEERDALAAKLAELEGQEPVAFGNRDELDDILADRHCLVTGVRSGFHRTPLYARPAPAEPVNARLLSSLNLARTCIAFDRNALVETHSDLNGNMDFLGEQARDEYDQILADIDNAIAAAQSAPKAVRLTDEEIIGIRQVLAGWDCNTPWSQTIALSRAIETAALRKNGIEVAE